MGIPPSLYYMDLSPVGSTVAVVPNYCFLSKEYRMIIATRIVFLALVCFCAMAGAAPVETIDLASSSDWTVSIDGGGSQTVTVPGNTRISDNAVFRRSITIPASAAGKVVKVLFGGVNYGCDVYLGATLITSHKNLMLPFEADLTGKVAAGSSYTLEVRAYSSAHYGNKIPQGCYWASLAYGITRYVKLVVLPQVYIEINGLVPGVYLVKMQAGAKSNAAMLLTAR